MVFVDIISNQGGKRSNAGRHPIPKPDKKQQCYAYIPTSRIEQLGGKQAVQQIMLNAVFNHDNMEIWANLLNDWDASDKSAESMIQLAEKYSFSLKS